MQPLTEEEFVFEKISFRLASRPRHSHGIDVSVRQSMSLSPLPQSPHLPYNKPGPLTTLPILDIRMIILKIFFCILVFFSTNFSVIFYIGAIFLNFFYCF